MCCSVASGHQRRILHGIVASSASPLDDATRSAALRGTNARRPNAAAGASRRSSVAPHTREYRRCSSRRSRCLLHHHQRQDAGRRASAAATVTVMMLGRTTCELLLLTHTLAFAVGRSSFMAAHIPHSYLPLTSISTLNQLSYLSNKLQLIYNQLSVR